MALVDDIRDEILAMMAANEAEFDGPTAKYNFADLMAQKMIEAGASSGIASIVAGDGITVDNTDPQNPIVSAGAGMVPFYADSVWTSFQNDSKTVSSVNLGSNSAYAVGFNVPVPTRIKSAKIEVSNYVGPNDAAFALYRIENGKATARIYYYPFTINTAGVYTFTAINLDLEPGNYAYATNQTLITGFRCIALPSNEFGVKSGLGATAYPYAKTAAVLTVPYLPDPFPVGQTDYTTTAVPLCAFEIEML